MELALVLPLVALLALLVVQVGLVARDQVLVTHAAREAARAAAVDDDPGAAGAGARASPRLRPPRPAGRAGGRDGPGGRVRVEATYRAATEVPLFGPLVDDVALRATATMRVER